MDWLPDNRLYRFKARVIAGSEEEDWIRFYRCQPGAKILQHPTVFYPRIFEDRDEVLEGVGPVDRRREWNAGHNHGYAGRCLQGDPAWLIDGIPQAVVDAGSDGKVCCMRLVGSAGGGARVFVDSGQADIVGSGGARAFVDLA